MTVNQKNKLWKGPSKVTSTNGKDDSKSKE